MEAMTFGTDPAPGLPKRKLPLIMATVALIAVIAAVLGAFVVLRGPSYDDYSGTGSGEVVVEVLAGDTLTAIGRTLQRKDVVADYRAFVAATTKRPESSRITPGFYQLKQKMSGQSALALLLNPASRLISRVVVPEGTRLNRIATVIAKELNVEPSAVQQAIKNAALPSYATGPEGFLFPATYDIAPNDTPDSVVAAMIRRFERAARAVDLAIRAAAIGRTPEEIVTIASIVEAEVDPADFGKAARVIYNRLERGMKLQMDSTLNYALGSSTLMFTRAQLANNSPYNTYAVQGLPPGPVGSPGQKALEAALAPEPGNWLFFVSVDPDRGITKFASTEAEFFRYRDEFRTWYRNNR